MPQKRMECFRLLLEHLSWIEYQFVRSIRDSRKAWRLGGMMRGVGGVRKSVHQSQLAKGLGLGLLCWGFKGVQDEIPFKRLALFKSGQWHFHQDNAPVHNSILVTDYLTKIVIKTVSQPPYSPELAPSDFWLFPKLKEKLRLSLWDNWRDESGCDEGHWPDHTRWLPWAFQKLLQLEEITSKGTRVSCMYYQ